MGDKVVFEKHALNLGKIVGNLQMVEMCARLAIVKLDQRFAKARTQLTTVKTGDFVEQDAFTNADDLRQTLEKYNKRTSTEFRLDVDALVRLRDAIAHGRTFGVGNSKHIRILKFGRKPMSDGKISVEMAEDMTDDWFAGHIRFLVDSLERLRKAVDYERREFE